MSSTVHPCEPTMEKLLKIQVKLAEACARGTDAMTMKRYLAVTAQLRRRVAAETSSEV